MVDKMQFTPQYLEELVPLYYLAFETASAVSRVLAIEKGEPETEMRISLTNEKIKIQCDGSLSLYKPDIPLQEELAHFHGLIRHWSLERSEEGGFLTHEMRRAAE